MNSNDQRQIHLGQLVFSHRSSDVLHIDGACDHLCFLSTQTDKNGRNSHTHLAPLDLHACLGCLHHQLHCASLKQLSFCRKQLELPILGAPELRNKVGHR